MTGSTELTQQERERRDAQSHRDREAARLKVATRPELTQPGWTMERLIGQMWDPETTSEEGIIMGVPDIAGSGDQTHVFTSVVDVQFKPNADGEFAIAVSNNPRTHVITTAIESTASTGTELAAARHLVPKAHAGATSIRRNQHWYDPDAFFVINDAPGTSGTAASVDSTLPLIITGDRFRLKSKKTISNRFYWDIRGTALQQSGITVLGRIAASRFFNVGNFQLALYGTADTSPGPTATRVANWSNSSVASDMNVSATSVDLSSYNSIFLCYTRTASTPDACLLSIDIGFTIPTAQTLATNSAAKYTVAAPGLDDPTFQGARLVSASLLIQDRSAEIYRGGDIALDRMSGAVVNGAISGDAEAMSYSQLQARNGAYAGDLANGGFSAWLPRTTAEWTKFHDTDTALEVFNSNVIVAAGKTSSPTQSAIHGRVFAIWQVITYDRKWNGQCRTYVPRGLTASDVYYVLFQQQVMFPSATCNPDHEQIKRWMEKAGAIALKVIKHAPGALLAAAKVAGILAAAAV